MARAAVRPNAAVATAYFAHVAAVLGRIAGVLGKLDDQQRYEALSDDVRKAWRTVFVADDGRIGHDRQDDYVRALAFDLLRPEQRDGAVRRLVELIEGNGYHIDTGFLSTPMLLDTLVAGGRADIAVRHLLQTANPSWLYPVLRGATTVWETWEGYENDGRGKQSHNHYALGSVADWLIEGLAGMSPAEPGWRTIRFSPLVVDELTYARASVPTPFGTASCAWNRDGNEVRVHVTVPSGALADIHVPQGIVRVGAGTYTVPWECPRP